MPHTLVGMASAHEHQYPGSRLGLPDSGIGSAAGTGIRVSAFALDLLVAFLIALLFTRPNLPQNWSLVVWVVISVVAVGLFGFTPGQFVCGIRVAPLGGRLLVGVWALPRTALTFLVVPVFLTDTDGRGLHDRVARTVVVKTR